MTHQALLQALWAQAWQLTALAIAVGLLARCIGYNRPHLAHALWLVVLLKCITPPVWESPLGVFSWLPPTSWNVADDRVEQPPALSDESTNTQPAGGITIAIGPIARVNESDRKPADASPANEKLSPRPVARTAVTIWLAGSSLVGVLAILRVAKCWRRLRQSTVESRPELEALLQTLATRLRLRCRVRLWIHGSRVGPAVIGLWRPTVLLPACVVDGRSPAELEPILAHELIHIRRGDLWVGLLQAVAQAIWWFHPLVWLAGRMITREAERCCDEEVLAELDCDPSRYARSLLGVLELKQMLTPAPAVPGVRVVDITSQRLERIMTLGQGCRRRTPWWCWMVMLVAALLTLPGLPLKTQAVEPSPSESAPVEQALPIANSPVATPTKLVEGIAADFPAERDGGIIQVEGLAADDGDIIQFEVGPAGEKTLHYRVSDVLDKIEDQTGVDRSAARRLLWTRLMATLRPATAPPRLVTTAPQRATIPAKIADPPAYWLRDLLVILQSAEAHRQTSAVIEEVRSLGMDMLEIEVRFLTSPLKLVTDVSNKWTTLPMIAEIPATADLPEKAPADTSGIATFMVEKNLPVILDLLDDARAKKLIDSMQGDRRANVLQAPRVRLFPGQVANVTDSTQTPFVVGFKDNKPQFHIVQQGINVLVRPRLEGDHTRLQFEIVSSGIREVDSVEVRGADGSLSTIQVPEVAQARVASTIDVPLGHTVLVAGLKVQSSSKKTKVAQSLGVLLTVRKVSAKDHNARADIGNGSTRDVEPAGFRRAIAGPSSAASAGRVRKALEIQSGSEHQSPASSRPVLSVCYAVADLVIPLPNVAPTAAPDNSQLKEPQQPAQADFRSLIELIKTTVQPESWDDLGEATIQPFKNNLSLVIAQNQNGHEQIVELLEQLRKARGITACVEMQPVNDIHKLCEILTLDPDKLAVERFLPISPEQTQRLNQTNQLLATAHRVELFSGQRSKMDSGMALGILNHGMTVRPVIADSYGSARLVVQALAADKKSPPVFTMTLRDGDSMLVDVSKISAPAVSEPKYVLFTPRIIARGTKGQ